jgi:hypothetical protein
MEIEISGRGEDQHQARRFWLDGSRLNPSSFDLDAVARIHLDPLISGLEVEFALLDEEDGTLEGVEIKGWEHLGCDTTSPGWPYPQVRARYRAFSKVSDPGLVERAGFKSEGRNSDS